MSPGLQLECPHCKLVHSEIAVVCAGCGCELHRAADAEARSPLGIIRSNAAPPTDDRLERTGSFRLLARTGSPSQYGRDLRLVGLRKLIPAAPRTSMRTANKGDATRVLARVDARNVDFERVEPWIYLVLGLATVPIFALTPITESIGAFLASVVHEAGHTVAAFLCGMPAMPQISLVGHTSAMHSDQSLGLVLVIGIALSLLAFRSYTGQTRWSAMGLIVAIYPVMALTDAKELFYLLGGHGAELACAVFCLSTALGGGFTTFKIERLFYGTVGWYLILRHFALCCSLMRTAEAQAHYKHQPLFVLTNDYMRAAVNVLSCPPENVVMGMLIASLLVLPAAILLWTASTSRRRH